MREREMGVIRWTKNRERKRIIKTLWELFL